jgi:hypothetical protein
LIGVTGNRERLEIYQFDPEIGWKTTPSTRYYRSSPYYAHFSYFDPDGFPTSEDRWKQRLDPAAPSFALIGDSMTEGYYVPYEKSFAAIVDRELPDLQVVNLGVSGYAPDQYLLASRRALPGRNVKRIGVIFYPGNDTVDVLSDRYLGYAKPVFGDSFAKPINLPLPNLRGAETLGGLRGFVNGSAIYSMFRPFYKRYISPPPEYETSRDRLRYREEGMAKSVKLMAAISSENPGVPSRIFYVPRLEEIGERDLLERNVAMFRDECEHNGVECVVPSFLTEAQDPDVFYLVGDGHLNATGTAELANVILAAYPDS